MALFACKTCPEHKKLSSLLYTQLQDALESRQKAERAWAEERKEMLDRIQSLSNPPSLRELRREGVQEPRQTSKTVQVPLNFPGFRPSTRPPVDIDRIAALRSSKEQANKAAEDTISALDKAVKLTNGVSE